MAKKKNKKKYNSNHSNKKNVRTNISAINEKNSNSFKQSAQIEDVKKDLSLKSNKNQNFKNASKKKTTQKKTNSKANKTEKNSALNENEKISGSVVVEQDENLNNSKKLDVRLFLKPILFIVFAIAIELINFKLLTVEDTLETSISISSLPSKFGIELGIILIYAGIIFAVPKVWVQNLLMYFFLGLMAVASAVNLSLMNLQGYCLNLSMISLIGEATNAFNTDFVDFGAIVGISVILMLLIIIEIVVDKILKIKFKLSKKIITTLTVTLSLAFSFFGTLTYVVTRANLDEYENKLYSYQFSSQGFFKTFGTLSIFTQPLSVSKVKIDEDEILKTLEANEVRENKYATLYGNNLIMIMVESLDSYGIDPVNTPTLYKLTKDGYYFNNYYSNNKTNISEFISLTGYVPNSNTTMLYSDNDLSVKYSLPNLFKQLGYSANYFHSYIGSFYNRDNINTKLGFDDVIDMIDAELEVNDFADWKPESEYLEKVITKLAPTDGTKFMSFYLTVATHGDYNTTLEAFSDYMTKYDENLEEFKNYLEEQGWNYPENDEDALNQLRNYKSRMIETDEMIQNLLDYLDETGLSENTDIIIFGDHNTYYHDLSYKIKGTNPTDYSQIESYNVPLILYTQNKDIKNWTNPNTTKCTVTNLYSTICYLYGLPYNKFFCQGSSVFDSNYEFFMFSKLTGYYSSKYYGYSIDNFKVISKSDPYTNSYEEKLFKNKILDFINKQIIITEISNKKMKA